MKLSEVINELVEERGLDKDALSSIICEGILAAYEKRYPELDFFVDYSKKEDEVLVRVRKKVVSHVLDPEKEVGLRKAHSVDPKAKIDDEVLLPFELPIGRIEILRAKQTIASSIRRVEAEEVCKEFAEKVGSIVHGVVHKCERNGALVKIRETLAFMPKSLSIPGSKCIVGAHVRALLKEVLPEPRNDSQLILDQSSSDFLRRLFELEIPEVFEQLIEIKTVVRAPGYKSKMVVVSNDKNIDPVGTCVGVGGARIRPILKEIGSEKIDIVAEQDSLEDLVKCALKPAEVNRVQIDGGLATVWVDEGQRSLAIGKMGQNIALASQLAGIHISLAPADSPGSVPVFVEEKKEEEKKSEKKEKEEE